MIIPALGQPALDRVAPRTEVPRYDRTRLATDIVPIGGFRRSYQALVVDRLFRSASQSATPSARATPSWRPCSTASLAPRSSAADAAAI